jgi:phosphotransferase system enzyme I (PtsP)
VVLLDADHGFLVINPSRAEVASVRAERREERERSELPGPVESDDSREAPDDETG